MQKWEYKIVHDPSEGELNALGEQGWELVGFNDSQSRLFQAAKIKNFRLGHYPS